MPRDAAFRYQYDDNDDNDDRELSPAFVQSVAEPSTLLPDQTMPARESLLTLPFELIEAIAQHVPPKGLARLSLVSHVAHAIFNPLLWRRVKQKLPAASRLITLSYLPHVAFIAHLDISMHLSQRNDHMIQKLRSLQNLLLSLSSPTSALRALILLFDIDSAEHFRLTSFPSEEAVLFTALKSCSFPRLRTFHLLGEGDPVWSADPALLRAFLIAHSSIEDLKLSLRTREHDQALTDDLLFVDVPPGVTILPALRSYSGSYAACEALCDGRRPIRDLELGPRSAWGVRGAYSCEGIVRTLRGTMGGLERLHLTYRSEAGENMRVLQGVAEACPNLVRFRGTFSGTTIAMYHPLHPLKRLTNLIIEFYPVDSDNIGDRVQVKDALRALVKRGFRSLGRVELKSVFDDLTLRYRVDHGEERDVCAV